MKHLLFFTFFLGLSSLLFALPNKSEDLGFGNTLVPGCTDPIACNFNLAATVDDGSCEYLQYYIPSNVNGGPIILACSNPGGVYELAINQGCIAQIVVNDPFCINTNWDSLCNDAYLACAVGCTDEFACNFNVEAITEDFSCQYPGCTDPDACNFDPLAGCESGDCTFPQYYLTTEIGGGPAILSCFNPGISYYLAEDQICAEAVILNNPSCEDFSWSLACMSAYLGCEIGCTDNSACNYNSDATVDDGSCVYGGCTNPLACNFDPAAACDDGSCDVPPPPVIVGISPSQVRCVGFFPHTIGGPNFCGVVEVLMNGQACEIISNNANSVSFFALPGSGTVPVEVITSHGSDTIMVSYIAPSISSLSQSNSSCEGGAELTIFGQHLCEATEVLFGTNSASILNSSTSSVNVIVPPGFGTVNVTVETASGITNSLLFSYDEPTINSTSISTLTCSGGEFVTISGEGFCDPVAVFLDGIEQTVTTSGFNSVEFITPPGFGDVQLTVESSGQVSNALILSYEGGGCTNPIAPNFNPNADCDDGSCIIVFEISSISPQFINCNGSSILTIDGIGFEGLIDVLLNGQSCNIISNTANSIVCETLPGTGIASVEVIAALGSTFSSIAYAAPQIDSTSVNVFPCTGGSFDIFGTNICNVTEVLIGGSSRAFTQNSQFIITSMPNGQTSTDLILISESGASNAFTLFYESPEVLGVFPFVLDCNGGESVSLYGRNFCSPIDVFVNGVQQFVNLSSFGELRFTSPPGDGESALTLVAGGVSYGPFTLTYQQSGCTEPNADNYNPDAVCDDGSCVLQPVPFINSINPSLIPCDGINQIEIDGINFNGLIQVLLGGTPCQIIQSDNSLIRILSIPGSGSTTLEVITTQGNAVIPVSYSPPIITAFSPEFVPFTCFDGSIVIQGANLCSLNEVIIDGVSVNFIQNSNSEITAEVPHGSGEVEVFVTSASGTSNTLILTYSPPSILSAVPENLSCEGGELVTLFIDEICFPGTLFVDGIEYPIEPPLTIHTASFISPAGSGLVPVQFETDGQLSEPFFLNYDIRGCTNPVACNFNPSAVCDDGFCIDEIPTIFGMSVVFIPCNPTSNITLFGDNLCGVTDVLMNGISCSNIIELSNGVSFLPIPGTGIAEIQVVTTHGTSEPFVRSYRIPTVTGLSPSSISCEGGTINIFGNNFCSPTELLIDGIPTAFNSISDFHITAVAPPGSGSVQVRVVSESGTSSALTLNYQPATIVSVIPSIFDCAGSEIITLNGTNLCGDQKVYINGAEQTLLSSSLTSLSFNSPAGSGDFDLSLEIDGQVVSTLNLSYAESGCTDPVACNYNPSAVCDNDSCIQINGNNSCPTDINQDGIVNTGDLNLLLGSYGLVCP